MSGEDSLRSILRLNNLFAFTAVRFDPQVNQYETSGTMPIFATLNLILYGGIYSVYLWQFTKNVERDFARYGIVPIFMKILTFQIVLFQYVLKIMNNFIRRNNMVKLLNVMKTLQQKTTFYGGFTDFKQFQSTLKRWLIICSFSNSCVFACTTIIYVITGRILNPFVATTQTLFTLVRFSNDIYLILFNFLVYMLRKNISVIKVLMMDVKREEWYNISRLHQDSIALYPLLIKCFSLPLISYVIQMLVSGTLQLFEIFQYAYELQENDTLTIIAEVSITVISIAPWIAKLCVTILHTGRAAREVRCSFLIKLFLRLLWFNCRWN